METHYTNLRLKLDFEWVMWSLAALFYFFLFLTFLEGGGEEEKLRGVFRLVWT
jgi:hypothetical protein